MEQRDQKLIFSHRNFGGGFYSVAGADPMVFWVAMAPCPSDYLKCLAYYHRLLQAGDVQG